jgi:putative transposase
VREYRRRLPHIDAPGVPTFVTWRLAGSLPKERSFLPEQLTSGAAFAAFDGLLDAARSGPVHLRLPEIATLVQEQLSKAPCTLHAYVVMPNHVHVLWTAKISLPELIRLVKGATAMRANRILGLEGQRFWEAEYFDRLVRNDEEFGRVRRYIELNPVKAALVARPEDFEWSSAYGRG